MFKTYDITMPPPRCLLYVSFFLLLLRRSAIQIQEKAITLAAGKWVGLLLNVLTLSETNSKFEPEKIGHPKRKDKSSEPTGNFQVRTCC